MTHLAEAMAEIARMTDEEDEALCLAIAADIEPELGPQVTAEVLTLARQVRQRLREERDRAIEYGIVEFRS